MALDMWFRDDVRRILAGLACSASRHTDDDYRQAYQDALQDVAVSFGVLQLPGDTVPLVPKINKLDTL